MWPRIRHAIEQPDVALHHHLHSATVRHSLHPQIAALCDVLTVLASVDVEFVKLAVFGEERGLDDRGAVEELCVVMGTRELAPRLACEDGLDGIVSVLSAVVKVLRGVHAPAG